LPPPNACSLAGRAARAWGRHATIASVAVRSTARPVRPDADAERGGKKMHASRQAKTAKRHKRPGRAPASVARPRPEVRRRGSTCRGKLRNKEAPFQHEVCALVRADSRAAELGLDAPRDLGPCEWRLIDHRRHQLPAHGVRQAHPSFAPWSTRSFTVLHACERSDNGRGRRTGAGLGPCEQSSFEERARGLIAFKR